MKEDWYCKTRLWFQQTFTLYMSHKQENVTSTASGRNYWFWLYLMQIQCFCCALHHFIISLEDAGMQAVNITQIHTDWPNVGGRNQSPQCLK